MQQCLWAMTTLLAVCGAGYIPPGPTYVCPTNKILLHPCECTASGYDGLRVRCVNTNLASMSVGLNNLATFKMPIEQLLLDRCNIARLHGSLFYKLKVRIMTIQNTPLTTIDEHTFHGVNRTLNELYLLNTTLQEFPKLAFRILGNLTILKIDQHHISAMATDAFGGGNIPGKLQKLHLSNGRLVHIPIETLTPLRKLKVLDLHGNQLAELKRNQFRGLRDTEVLDLSFNRLVKVDSSHLADLTKLSWCNVSNNAITELSRGAFARNAVLRVLNMSYNKIRRLDTTSFRGMRFLRRLYLADNLITDVGRGTFGSVTRIGTIDLARNLITKIDYQMFYQLNYVEIIDVSANNVTEIQKLAFKDLYLTNINLSHNAIDNIDSGAFENCANITKLDLSFNKITTIPKRAFDDTTYALELQLSYNYLTELNQVPLHNMTGLKVLNVSHNELHTVPRQTFPKLYELHTIDLSYNNLSEIANGVFQTLFSLRNLNLSHNSLEKLRPSTFGTLPTLLDLDLSHNRLRDVARSALAKLASARTLSLQHNLLETVFQLPISVGSVDLSYNRLARIPERAWPSMNAALAFNFRGNQLGANLVRGSFSPLLTLRVLDLSENGITEVPWEALADLTSLQYLYLENNNLTVLKRAAFGRLPVVFELNMANNQIHQVSPRAFEGLLQLLTLNLTGNNLSHIPNGAFQGLVSLRTLDLSHNSLEKLDNKTHGLLDDCLSLERLNVSHNKISFITRKTFPSNPYIPYKLHDIDLSYNAMPALTYDLVFGTSRVQILNVSHNSISDIRKGVLGNLTNLRTLDLSYNQLEDLVKDADVFNLPHNITEIYLNNNHLKQLPIGKLTQAADLVVLDVSGNQLQSFESELVTMVQQGASVRLEENPLNCDCFLRPIKRYLSQRVDVEDHYTRLQCQLPLFLKGEYLSELPDDRLNCVNNVANQAKFSTLDIYDLTSDLKFRDVKFTKEKISLRWLVNNVVDIADFHILIRKNSKLAQGEPSVLYEADVPYYLRTLDIATQTDASLAKALVHNKGDLQVCILARDSDSNIRNWFKNQCKMIPKDFASSAPIPSCTICYPLLLSVAVIFL